MSKNRNSLFVVFTGIIIALCRFILGSVETKTDDDCHILIIMAVVNYIALGFVLLFLYNGFYNICKTKIENSGLETKFKKKCNFLTFIYSAILLILYLVMGILYILVFKSSDLNDVISIIALALSIATNGLLEEYKNGYYKFILETARFLIKK